MHSETSMALAFNSRSNLKYMEEVQILLVNNKQLVASGSYLHEFLLAIP